MSTLLRASELAKRPVVTFSGEVVGQIKDIVYAAGGGQVGAFTLAGRGLFAGPSHTAVLWSSVVGLGPDAMVIETERDVVPDTEVLSQPAGSGGSGGGDVLRSRVLTDQGTALGTVSDVIIGIAGSGAQADVIGYEIEPAETLGRGGQRLLIPLPDTLAASAENLIVPASASQYLTDDLGRFGSAVDSFRAQLAAPTISQAQ